MSVKIKYVLLAVLYSTLFGIALWAAYVAGTQLFPPMPQPTDELAGKAVPNRFDFGTVQTGAYAEASLRIFGKGKEAAGVGIQIQPPRFVEIQNVETRHLVYGPAGERVVFDISLAVSTQRIGRHSGTMKVRIGGQRLEIPIEVHVTAKNSYATSVLVVETPFTAMSTDDTSLFEPWLSLVETAGLDVHYLNVDRKQPVLREMDLADFDVVLLATGGLVFLRDEDIERLKSFVSDGGRLVLCANAYFMGSVEKANQLLVPAGLHMTDTEATRPHKFTLTGEEIIGDPLTEGVRVVKLFRPSPIKVTDPFQGRLLVKAPPYPGEGFAAAGRFGKGEVIVLGQSLWWDWLAGERLNGSDNATLFRNFLTYRKEVE